MTRRLLLLIALATAAPAAVLAATPAKDAAFRHCTERDLCPFKFETDRRGRYVKDIRLYPKCAPVPTRWPRIRVRRGAFAREGTIRDVNGAKLTYVIRGEFRTRRKAVGTYEVERRDCKDRRRKFTARRYGPAQPGV